MHKSVWWSCSRFFHAIPRALGHAKVPVGIAKGSPVSLPARIHLRPPSRCNAKSLFTCHGAPFVMSRIPSDALCFPCRFVCCAWSDSRIVVCLRKSGVLNRCRGQEAIQLFLRPLSTIRLSCIVTKSPPRMNSSGCCLLFRPVVFFVSANRKKAAKCLCTEVFVHPILVIEGSII